MKTELEALESIYWYIVATGAEDDYKKYYERIKSFIKDAKKYKKYKKALEIIKEKRVYPSFLLNTKNLEEYNKEVIQKLTKEEYDLLKEIFGNE